jgi:hypothetical protein
MIVKNLKPEERIVFLLIKMGWPVVRQPLRKGIYLNA